MLDPRAARRSTRRVRALALGLMAVLAVAGFLGLAGAVWSTARIDRYVEQAVPRAQAVDRAAAAVLDAQRSMERALTAPSVEQRGQRLELVDGMIEEAASLVAAAGATETGPLDDRLGSALDGWRAAITTAAGAAGESGDLSDPEIAASLDVSDDRHDLLQDRLGELRADRSVELGRAESQVRRSATVLLLVLIATVLIGVLVAWRVVLHGARMARARLDLGDAEIVEVPPFAPSAPPPFLLGDAWRPAVVVPLDPPQLRAPPREAAGSATVPVVSLSVLRRTDSGVAEEAEPWGPRGSEDERGTEQDAPIMIGEPPQAGGLDALTGLLDGTGLGRSVAAVMFARREMALALGDIDDFTLFNERHGFHVGDEALRVVARVLLESAGPEDLCGRLGAGVFMLAFPDIDEAEAVDAAKRIQRNLAVAVTRGDCPRFTISFGVSALQPGQSFADVVSSSRTALAIAEVGGPDRVAVAGDIGTLPPPDGLERVDDVPPPTPLRPVVGGPVEPATPATETDIDPWPGQAVASGP